MQAFKALLLAIILMSVAKSGWAASSGQFYFYTFEAALASDPAKKLLNPTLKLSWGNQQAPALAEKAPPDVYTGTEKNSRLIFRGEPREVCMEAFANALRSLTEDARMRDYDAMVNIRGELKGGPDYSTSGFDCDAGMQTTSVRLKGEFAVTTTAAALAEEQERDPARRVAPQRTAPLSKNAIVLSLADIVASPEAVGVLGPIKGHVGLYGAPAYTERAGSEQYDDSSKIQNDNKDAACKQAVLLVLKSIAKEAKQRGYDGIIKIRSYLDDQFPAKDTDLECQIGFRSASVNLFASFAKLK